ncbi:MAG: hypothetical protein E6J02_12005 [Chloroflexi bacterium]|nr:MAG: hypothetical protein E6J02_12005 [Chloroflexota bacterium]
MVDRSAAFLESLKAFGEEDWRRIEASLAHAGVGLAAWDEAWDRALDLGGLEAGLVALKVARRGGASVVAQAAAAGAAAALDAGARLSPAACELLCGPFATLLNVEAEVLAS